MRFKLGLMSISLALTLTGALRAYGAPASKLIADHPVEITLPAETAVFPPGKGADLANSYCLMCHSVEMVLQQPPLSKKDWQAEVNKMRNAYGAPVPAEQVDAIVDYLLTLSKSPL